VIYKYTYIFLYQNNMRSNQAVKRGSGEKKNETRHTHTHSLSFRNEACGNYDKTNIISTFCSPHSQSFSYIYILYI
jgi:hypothetical protein